MTSPLESSPMLGQAMGGSIPNTNRVAAGTSQGRATRQGQGQHYVELLGQCEREREAVMQFLKEIDVPPARAT